ncbi:MAG: HrcA family transcriptional regulator, partial [Candidatus Methylomirabilales bacterium]
MLLDERQRTVLKAVIHDYISTAEPVSSRSISRRYLSYLSPATIRNIMSDLAEMGYLEQPHTSAGRVPKWAAFSTFEWTCQHDRPSV